MNTASISEIAGFGDRWHGLIPGRLTVLYSDASAVEYLSDDDDRAEFVIAGDQSQQNNWTYTPQLTGNRRQLSMVTIPSVTRVEYYHNQSPIVNGPAEIRMDLPQGEYILFRRSGAWSNDDQRYLVPIERGLPSGYKIFYDYPDTSEYPDVIRDSFGRQMTLTWADAVSAEDGTRGTSLPQQKVVTQIVLPDSTKLIYSYGFGLDLTGRSYKNRLEKVERRTAATDALLWSRSYLYENTDFPNVLTGVKDQNNARLSTYAYDQAGEATSTELAGGVDKYTIANYYEPAYAGDQRYIVRQVTNPLGRREDYHFYNGGLNYLSPQLLMSITGLATTTVPADSRSFTYSGYIGDYAQTGSTDARGSSSSITNDAQLRPTLVNEVYNTVSARGTNVGWHSSLDLPTHFDRPGLSIDYTYSDSGQILSSTETDTTTQAIPYSTNGQTRTTTYTWSPEGRILSINGPKPVMDGKDDTFTFTYDTNGNLLTSSNGLNQVTTFAAYDANGRPGTMTDPNGIVTAFTYDALGRTTVINVKSPTESTADAITTIEYDIEGRVIGVTLPATDKLIIDYNLAGQMTAIRAASGERVDYVNNAMGGVTSETVRRVNGTIARQITRTFDSLNRLLTETLGTNRTKTWAYDVNGNVTSVTPARNNATQAAFDPLNRLVQTIAADTGSTDLTYTPWDDVATQTDPNLVKTTYIRNGFGDVIQETSPDRGTSTYTYNNGGELISTTDGRGQVVNITRDILGRITSKTPVGQPANQVITFNYDTGGIGGYQIGRLTKMVDGTGTTVFQYDHRGNMIAKRQTIGTTVVTLSYGYDFGDRVNQIVYPSGRIVGYPRDSKGRVLTVRTKANSSVSSWTTLATWMTYEAFGDLKQATLGNTLSMANNWGNDGRLASRRLYPTNGGAYLSQLTYAYDNDDNIIGITDSVDASKTASYAYDAVGRLTRIIGSSGTYHRQDYLHDLNGNRTSVEYRVNADDASPSQTDTYILTAGTNRLASVTQLAGTRSINYDNRGNTVSENRAGGISVAATYDGYGRLTGYSRTGDPPQTNTYNGLDDRVVITSGSATSRFLYDNDGRVIGEYGASAAAADVKAEWIWMEPTVEAAHMPFGGNDGSGGYAPIAVAIGNTGTINWVHATHIGVPLVFTTSAGAVTTFPTVTLLGFPGQLRTFADLYYNRYRDYDPTVGRYIQADPIGLEGGANPYVYAGNNPIRFADPEGLAAWPLPAGLGAAGAGAAEGGEGGSLLGPLGTAGGVIGGAIIGYEISRHCRGDHDECQLLRDKEEQYCDRKFSPMRGAVGRCYNRARINYDLCRRGMPQLPWWSDRDEDGTPPLPRPPRKLRRF